MNYEVSITQTGRDGTVFYLEDKQQLSFSWEFSTDGVLLFVPSLRHWNNFCDTNDFSKARNRRDELLKRVCEYVVRQKASGLSILLKMIIFQFHF